jgi:hypothetical protein
MAKLVFTKDIVSTLYADGDNGAKYTLNMHHHYNGTSLHRFVGHKIEWGRNHIKLKTQDEVEALAQFIEDNHKTLTLEQLDNIEEVYLKSKEAADGN